MGSPFVGRRIQRAMVRLAWAKLRKRYSIFIVMILLVLLGAFFCSIKPRVLCTRWLLPWLRKRLSMLQPTNPLANSAMWLSCAA